MYYACKSSLEQYYYFFIEFKTPLKMLQKSKTAGIAVESEAEKDGGDVTC